MTLRLSRFLLLLSMIFMSATVCRAQLTSASAFANAPATLFPLLDRNARLDMIDYFTSGSSTPSTNALGGRSRITALQPEAATIVMSDASTYQIALLPTNSGDTLIAVIRTVATPALDSRITIYQRDWQPVTGSKFQEPTLRDWLSSAGRKHADEVEAVVPFILASYAYDPATSTLTLTNNLKNFLSTDVYELVSPWLAPSLTYRWDGRKIKPAG